MNCIKYFWRLFFALVTRNSVAFLVFLAVALCVTVLAELYVTQFLCKTERWHVLDACVNENLVIWLPEGNVILITPIDKEKYPADWHSYRGAMGNDFRVSGYGHSGWNRSYGSLFYQTEYHWINNRAKIRIFDFDISIYRGKSVVIGSCSFQIDERSPLIIQLGKDGSSQALSDYPVEVLPCVKRLNTRYVWDKYRIRMCPCPGGGPCKCRDTALSDSESGMPIE